jgi:cytochrome c5
MQSPAWHCAVRPLHHLCLAVSLLGTGLALAAEAQPAQEAAAGVGRRAPAPLTGPQVYRQVCIACHAPPGVGGAPPLGSAEAWAPRIAQGVDTLISHALTGFTGKTGVMPRKGERPDLSDAEISSAVRYMVEQASQ